MIVLAKLVILVIKGLTAIKMLVLLLIVKYVQMPMIARSVQMVLKELTVKKKKKKPQK